jgi:type IV pilus biogenesis protein CpaD/CtpE
MSKSYRSVLTAAAAAVSLSCLTAPAIAQGAWAAQHPLRAEVNARLAKQDHRIDEKVRAAQMRPGQAARLHAADQRIRDHEQRMAAMHGGDITPREQAKLNAEEDRVSREIGP